MGPIPAALPSTPPSWSRVLGGWSPDWAMLVVLATGALYLAGVQRLAGRGRRWPRGRSVSFAAGLVAVAFATASGLARYDTTRFSIHIVQHLLLGMVGPLLLVLGAPVTLALQASDRRTRRRILGLLRSRPVAVVTHPTVVWIVFAGTLAGLYFTPLYGATLRNDAFHELVHVHFVVVGCLFFAYAVGIDPLPHRFGYGARALFVAVVLPFHAFVGVALLSHRGLIAASWYGTAPAWVRNGALADQRTGAGILWAFGELLGLLTLGIVLAQWMRHEDRVARRADARAEAAALVG